MRDSPASGFVSGLRFAGVFARVWGRLAFHLVGVLGLWRAVVALVRYLSRDTRLNAAAPSRLVHHAGHAWVVPDLPPVDSPAFVDCLAREVRSSAFGEPARPVTAILSLTARCPNRCPYCYVHGAVAEAADPPLDLLVDAVERFRALGVHTFHLSGGEPALRWDDVAALVRRFSPGGPRFWMLTTGAGLDAGRLQVLADAGLTGIMVGLDGDEPVHTDRIKGNDGAWETATLTLRRACAAGLLVAVNAVISRDLLDPAAFQRFVDAMAALGVSFVNAYAPRVQERSLPAALAPFTVEEHQRLHALARRCNRSRVAGPLVYTPDVWEAIRGCQGGRSFLYVDPAGELRRCPFLKRSYGNLRDRDPGAALERMRADRDPEVCAGNRLLTEALGRRR